MPWDSLRRRLANTGRGRGRVLGIIYVLLAFAAVCSIGVPGFLNVGNFLNIGLQGSTLLILSLGMTFAIASRGIDLSVGAVLSLAGVVMGFLLQSGASLPLAIAAGVGTGAVCGTINGTLIGYGRLNAFIATFGMYGMASSIALVLSNGTSIAGFPPELLYIGSGQILGLPIPLLIGTVALLAMFYLQRYTRFGTWVFAIGDNEEAALLTGVPVKRQKLLIYALCGLLAGIGGAVLGGRMNSAHPTVGLGMEFDAIAAVVVGGTPFSGGEGGVGRTLVGALIISILRNTLNLLGLPTSWQIFATGLAIIVSISIETQLSRRQAAAGGS